MQSNLRPRSFRRNVIASAGGTAVGSVAQLILIMILSRTLGVRDYAGFLTAAAVIAVGEMGSDFGTRIWATREFALQGASREIFYTGLWSKLVYSAIVALIIVLIARHTLTLSLTDIIICVLIAVTQSSTDPSLWFFRGRERLDLEALAVVLWRVGYMLLLAWLAHLGVSLTWLLIGWLAVNVTRVVATLASRPLRFVFTHGVHTGNGTYGNVARVLVIAFPIGVAYLMVALYQRLGVLTLNDLDTSRQVALYGTAFSLMGAAGFLAASITHAAFPALTRAIESRQYAAVNDIVYRKLILISYVFVPVAALGTILSPLFIALFYGSAYRDAGMVLALLMPGLYISSINFSAKYTLNATGLNWFDTAATGISIAVFFAILCMPLDIQKSELAAIAYGLGETSGFVGRYVFLRLRSSIRISRVWIYLGSFTFLFVLTLLLRNVGVALRDVVLSRVLPMLHRLAMPG